MKNVFPLVIGLLAVLLAIGLIGLLAYNPASTSGEQLDTLELETAPVQNVSQTLDSEITCADGSIAIIKKEVVPINDGEDYCYSVTVEQEKPNATYQMDITRTPSADVSISIFDESGNKIQTIEAEKIPMYDDVVDFMDINCDGYVDLLLNGGGTRNELHVLYVWDVTSSQFLEVICDEELYYIEIEDGLVKNWVKSTDYVLFQCFAWEGGNTLELVSEEVIILG